MDRIKIALAQMESEPGDQPSNLRKMLGYVKRAGRGRRPAGHLPGNVPARLHGDGRQGFQGILSVGERLPG